MINMISGAAHALESIGLDYGGAAIMVCGFIGLAGLFVAAKIIETIKLLSER